MINPIFLPQNSKRRKKTTQQQTIQANTIRRQYKLIHQLDCIYQGQVNESYQKQGFGIQQTNDFHTYLGFWKCSKVHGIGMIILPEGGLIYGNFKDNELFGVALTDNKLKLRIGVFQKYQIAGIGFQYIYSESKWKLSRFHKGISIETISETISSIENGVPSMMNLHEDMCLLMSRYLSKQYFDLSPKSFIQRSYRSYTQMNVHKIGNYLYFGQVVEGKYWGIGLIYDKKNGYPIQIGYYEMGQLNGYGLKLDRDKNKIQIGLYKKGKKEGFFYERTNNLQTIVEYQKNYLRGEHPEMNRQKIRNYQKIFNYQKNDFFSEKNKIKFHVLKELLNFDQKQLLKLNQTLKSSFSAGKGKQKLQKSQQKHSDIKSTKYMAPEISVHKSTVQIMRQKLSDIENIIKRSQAITKDQKLKKQDKSKKQSSKKVNFLQVSAQEGKKSQLIEDESIENQYEPINKNYNSPNFRNDNGGRKSALIKSPISQRKIWSPNRSHVNNTTGKKQSSTRLDQMQSFRPVSSFIQLSPQSNSNLSPTRNDINVSRRKRRIFQ